MARKTNKLQCPRNGQAALPKDGAGAAQGAVPPDRAGGDRDISPPVNVSSHHWSFGNVAVVGVLVAVVSWFLSMYKNLDDKIEKTVEKFERRFETEAQKLEERVGVVIARGEAMGRDYANARTNQRMVSLISDFGADSPNIHLLKGKIFKHCRGATVTDITHSIPSFDVLGGAWILSNVAKHLPDETVIWGMVNPGGRLSEHGIFLVTKKPRHYFVGATKELFAEVVAQQELEVAYECPIEKDDKYGTVTLSRLVASLQQGVTIEGLIEKGLIGEKPVRYEPASMKEPVVWTANSVTGTVCSIDRPWGNINTDIAPSNTFFSERGRYSVEIGTNKMAHLVYGKSYDAGEGWPGVILERNGWIQVAIHCDKANAYFKVDEKGHERITISKEDVTAGAPATP